MNSKIAHLIIALTLLASLPRATADDNPKEQVTLSFQGRLILSAAGQPASGNYDMTFTLFNTISNGSPVAGPITNSAVTVNSNGLFTALMDFGASPFAGNTTNWLEIGVQTNGGTGFTTLTPRQLLTPVPQSIYAGTAGVANAVAATTIIQGQSLVIGQSNTVSGAYSTVAGGGYNTAATDYAVVAGGFGNTASSNADTVAGGSGNTASGPNASVGGGTGNVATGQNSVVAGGSNNSATGTNATVVGGDNNAALDYDFIGGGQSNTIGSAWSVLQGGFFNHVHEGAFYQTISGGQANNTFAFGCVIGGGILNTIQLGANEATISGGDRNVIQANAVEATIAGGTLNTIQTGGSDAAIAGGYGNTIQPPSTTGSYSFIGGGYVNTIYTNAQYSFIGGGGNNSIGPSAASGSLTLYAAIGGGRQNTALNSYSTVSGGATNLASGNYATISGGDQNLIQSDSTESVISGGGANTVQVFAADSTISGGYGNLVGGGLGVNTNTGVVITNTAYATVGGGLMNTVSNYASTVSGGGNNLAGNAYATIPGGQQAVATNYAQLAYSAGQFQNPGDSQYSLYVLRGQTDYINTSTGNFVHTANLYLDGNALEIGLPASRSVAYNIRVVARIAGNSGPTTTVFLIRGGASGSSQSVGTPIFDPFTLNELGLVAGDVTLSVTPSGFLRVSVNDAGYTGTTMINWTATVQTTEESL